MEDGTIRTLCAAVAAQILVPIDASAAPLPCNSVSSTTPSSSAEATSVSSSFTLQELKRSADAVTQNAITLYRLCRHARPPVQISPHDSGAAQDAAYCVGASLRLLQPAVWEALSRRALLLRPRAPSLRLGRPVPVEVSLKELERFDARTQHLMKKGGVATAPITAATASKDSQKPSSASHWNGTASVIIDAVLAERLAALYFYPLLTPIQRKRYPQMMQDLRPEAFGTAKMLPPAGGRNGKRGRASGRPSDRSDGGPSEGMCLYGAYHCDDGDMVVHRADPAGDTTAEGFYPLDDDNTSDSSDGAQSSEGDAAWHALRAVTLGLAHDERTEALPAGPSVGDYLPPHHHYPAAPASLLRSARQLPLVEISAQVEATRHFLFWRGLEALVMCPLLYQPSHSGTHHNNISAQPSSWSLPSSHSHQTTTWDTLHNQLSQVCGSVCQMVLGVSKHPYSMLSGATSFVSWSGPHMLCPTRVQAHRLLPGPPSLVTGPSLWHRLLLCAGWLVIYAEVILPHTIECLKARLREGEKETAAHADGMPSPAGERMGGTSNVFTPPNILSSIEMDTIVYAVTVVREARHYDAVSCPVCDGLRTERATLRWASLSSGPRAALRRAMQPFLQQYCDQGGVTSATQTTTTSAGAAAASSSASRGTTIELATWLDSPYEAHLRACWGAFASSQSMKSATAVLRFAGTSPSACHGDDVKDSDDEDTEEDRRLQLDARGVFVQVVARRLHALAELLNFTARRSGSRSTNRHGVGTRCPLQPPPTEEESNVLRRHGWVLLADDDPVKGSNSHRNTQQPPPPSAVALRELPTCNLLDLVTRVLLVGCPTERWAAFLLSPSTVASLHRRGDAAVAVASPSPWRRVNRFSESSTSSSKWTKEPLPMPATATSQAPCDATPHAQHQASLTPLRATRAHLQTSIRQLQVQRTQVHELLDFCPRIPPLRDEDAVLECSRCYSFFHQDCVGPEQRDVAQRCFLCHTCRLRCASALSPICKELEEEAE